MDLAVTDISIVPLFADRITSAQGLWRGAKIHGPLAEKPTRWGMSAFWGKADMPIALQMSAFDPKRTSRLMGKRGWLYAVSPSPPSRLPCDR